MSIFDNLFSTWGTTKDKFAEVAESTQKKIDTFLEEKKKKEPKPIFSEQSENRKILNINYNSQRDNKFSPRSACNVTSIQMALSNHYGITDDEIFLLCNSKDMENRIRIKYPKDFSKWIYPNYFRKNSANEVFVVLLEAVQVIMDSTKYVKIQWNLTDEIIKKEIDLGYPFVACGKLVPLGGGRFGGHFITIIGYDKNSWIVHDPFGDWNTGYKSQKGEGLYYSRAKIKSKLYSYGFKIHSDKRLIV